MGFFDNVKAPPTEATVTHLPPVAPGGSKPYAAAALQREAEAVATTPEGQRNESLNRAAFRMGRHVGAGSIDAETVRITLADAGRACGLPQHEIDTILRDSANSGINQGRAVPRHPAPLPEIPTVTLLETPEGEDGPNIGAMFPILDWQELWERDDEDEWIVEPILPARRSVALYSAPKVGKSLLMLEIAVAISRASTVLGVTPDRPRRVLYVDFENDPRGDVRTRLESMDVGPADLGNLCYLSFPTIAKLDTPAGGYQLVAAAQHYGCEVVVIDTVSRAVSGEENANDTWLAFYRNTGLLLKSLGIACIRLDHTGKDRAKGMRGGSAKYGDVDAVWKLDMVSEDNLTLECTDHRMPIPERFLALVRESYPLRHVVAGTHWSDAIDARARQVDQVLTDLGVPAHASNRAAREALKAAGEKASADVLSRAVKARQLRLDVSTEKGSNA